MSNCIERFDHFVLPVDDVLAAEDFYTGVFGCPVAINSKGRQMRFGLHVREWMAGLRPHTFFIAAGRRIGVYLQCEPRPRKVDGLRGAPTCSFESTTDGLDRIAASLDARGAAREGPFDENSSIAARSLYFNDPAGNHFHVYVPREGAGNPARGVRGEGPITGIGYLRVEAPELEKSIRFYRDLLGLELVGEGRDASLDAREAILALPSGQRVILTEVPFAHPGIDLDSTKAGPHLAYYVRAGAWDELCAKLEAAGLEHADHGAALKDRHGGERDTYVSDPAGYVIQLVSEAKT